MIKAFFSIILISLSAYCTAQQPITENVALRAKDSTEYVEHIVDSLTKHIFIENTKPTGYVNDFENVLDSATIKYLTTQISQHEKKTTNQIVVVTVGYIGPYADDLDTYTYHLANEWGVGQKDKNNGVVIIVSTGLRKARITTGYGLEIALPDAECKRILDDMMFPEFRKNNYAAGITNGLMEIIRILEK